MTATSQNNDKNKQPFNWIIGIGIIVVIILVIIIFVVMNSLRTNTSLSSFKTHYLSSFMQSCEKVEGNTSTTLCTCIGNHLLTNYTDTQLMSISEQYSATGRIPQQVVSAARICRSSM